jgi:hypothetical protein
MSLSIIFIGACSFFGANSIFGIKESKIIPLHDTSVLNDATIIGLMAQNFEYYEGLLNKTRMLVRGGGGKVEPAKIEPAAPAAAQSTTTATTASSGFDLTSIFEHLHDSRLNPWLAKRCKPNDSFCRNEYSQNKPFPHINFYDFWPSELAKAVDNETEKWVQMSYGLNSGKPCQIPGSCYYEPPYSQKLAILDEHHMGVATRLLLSMLKSSNMVCECICICLLRV